MGVFGRGAATTAFLLVIVGGLAFAHPDTNSDGKVDGRDLFVFALHWGQDYQWTVDLNLDSKVDDKDLLCFMRDYQCRWTIPTPTPTPPGRLPAPEWLHPSFGENGQVFTPWEITQDNFLDWTDVNGASQYVYEYKVVAETPPPPSSPGISTPGTYKVPRTPVPPGEVPISNSSYKYLYAPAYGVNNLFIVRVAALDRSPTPKLGLWSQRIVFKSGQPTSTDTPTPTPTYPPTPAIDYNSDGTIDCDDLFIFQNAWGTSASEKAYNATADVDGDNDVDAGDLTLFQSEARRRRVPIGAPRLVFPPNNYEISMFDVVDGLVFDWDPVPYTPGGILYKFELVRDLDQSSVSLETTRDSQIFYSASPGFVWGTGKSFYTWRVWAVSPYGIKPDGPVSENHLIIVGLTGKPTSP